ncbi:MAG TPA: hypothetical protein VGE08_14035 [Steroidobacter sp.]
MRLKYSNPIRLDEVAADFPDMTAIIALPSRPKQVHELILKQNAIAALELELRPLAAPANRNNAVRQAVTPRRLRSCT